MNQNELMELLKQYTAGGGDLAEAANYINTMALNNGTPFLGLKQWQRSDKPVMEDFNEDNRIIDEHLRALTDTRPDRDEVNAALANKVNVDGSSPITGSLKVPKLEVDAINSSPAVELKSDGVLRSALYVNTDYDCTVLLARNRTGDEYKEIIFDYHGNTLVAPGFTVNTEHPNAIVRLMRDGVLQAELYANGEASCTALRTYDATGTQYRELVLDYNGGALYWDGKRVLTE